MSTVMMHPRVHLPEGSARPQLTGGVRRAPARVYRADRYGVRGEEITDRILGGSVDLDASRRILGTARLETRHPDDLARWAWVAIDREVTPEGRPTVTTPLGLYRCAKPETSYRSRHADTVMPAEDMTALLHDRRFTNGWNAIPQFGHDDNLSLLLLACNIPRHRLPSTTRAFPAGRSWPAGVSAWEVATAICRAAGWTEPYAAWDGAIEVRELATADTAAVATYRLGEDARVVGEPGRRPSTEAFANVVVMISEGQDRPTLIAEARNDDPGDPNSTTHPEGPGEVVAPPVAANDVTDQVVLEILAELALLRHSDTETLTLRLEAGTTHGLHDVLQIAVPTDRPHLAGLAGRWQVRSVAQGLAGDGAVTLRAERSLGRGAV